VTVAAWRSEVVLAIDAGSLALARGEEYAERGLVEIVIAADEHVAATADVIGSACG